MSLAIWRFAGAVLVVVTPCIAAAADLPPQLPAAPPTAPANYSAATPDWIVTVGLEARVIPAWPGASDSKFGWNAFPLFGIRKAGTPPGFSGARDSFGFPIINLSQFQLGPAAKLINQRKASDYTQLNGLGDVDFAIQAGGYADFWPVPWLRLRTEIRQGFGGETGVTGDEFLDAVVPVEQFRFSGGPRLTWQSAAAVSPYFSITAAQSAASTVSGLPQLPVYNAAGGLYSYGAGAKVEYFWSPQWATHVIAEEERLTGAAADSPLVIQRGSPNQFTIGLGGTYSFDMRPLW